MLFAAGLVHPNEVTDMFGGANKGLGHDFYDRDFTEKNCSASNMPFFATAIILTLRTEKLRNRTLKTENALKTAARSLTDTAA